MHSSARLIFLLLASVSIFLLPHNVAADTTYTATITVRGLPSNMSTLVYVDGSPNGTVSGGESRSFVFSNSSFTHVITVDFYVPHSAGINGTRYYEQETSWAFNTAGNHVFSYTTQYYLNVETPRSSATGEGWYDSGSVVQVAVKEGEISEGEGTRHIFTGWTGDASGTALTSNIIMMNRPKKAVAGWKTQFYLTVESEPPSIAGLSGSGWYDASSEVQFSAPEILQANEDTRLRFEYWSGDYPGELASGRVIMDRPKLVMAHYISQYLLSVEFNPASILSLFNETHAGWYDANVNVQLGPAPSIIDLSSVERLQFVSWIDNGSSSPDVSISALMNKPHKVVLTYKTQYHIDVRSSYGSASGSGWYDKGSTATISVQASSGSWPVSYKFSDWRIDPEMGQISRTDDTWSLTVDRPYTVEALWAVDYFPILLLVGGGGAGVAVVSAGLILASRRGLLPRSPRGLRLPRPTVRLAGGTRICPSCTNPMPAAASFCQRCGASVSAAVPSPLEEKVYDYILKHEGVISMSKASNDLGISVQEIKEITEDLKKKGRLVQ